MNRGRKLQEVNVISLAVQQCWSNIRACLSTILKLSRLIENVSQSTLCISYRNFCYILRNVHFFGIG